MAFLVNSKIWVLAIAPVCISILCCHLGKAEYVPQLGSNHDPANGDVPQAGAEHDPAPIVAKALLCFNDKSIYCSCEESYRLTESGNINVPPEYTNQYCDGPCLQETYLVLDCIENILINFEFYNKATIQDVRDTVKAGCTYGPERGDFNVAGHIQAERSSAHKVARQILFVLGLMIIGHALLLYYV